jgi:hypothetical protein
MCTTGVCYLYLHKCCGRMCLLGCSQLLACAQCRNCSSSAPSSSVVSCHFLFPLMLLVEHEGDALLVGLQCEVGTSKEVTPVMHRFHDGLGFLLNCRVLDLGRLEGSGEEGDWSTRLIQHSRYSVVRGVSFQSEGNCDIYGTHCRLLDIFLQSIEGIQGFTREWK